MKKKLLIASYTALAISFAFTGCSKSNNTTANETTATETSQSSESEESEFNFDVTELPQLDGVKTGDTIATIKTNYGDIKVWFFPEYAPKAVENFTTHAKEGYYDNLIFHRVINNFMIQGGDPQGTGTGGESIWGADFEIENSPNLRNFRGALCMANTGQPNSNSSQFYIVQAPADEAVNQLNSLKARADEADFNMVYPEEVINAYNEIGGTPSLDFGFSGVGYTVFGQVYEGLDVVDKIAAVQTDSNDKPNEDVIISGIEVGTY